MFGHVVQAKNDLVFVLTVEVLLTGQICFQKHLN